MKYQLKSYNSTCKIVVKVPKMMMKLLLYSAENFLGWYSGSRSGYEPVKDPVAT